MHLYTQIYEFSASIGALEGYVYNKKNIDEIDMKALDVWTGNQIDAYEMIPPDVLEKIQDSLDLTLNRAISSLNPLLAKDHEVMKRLNSMIHSKNDCSPDDFQKKEMVSRTIMNEHPVISGKLIQGAKKAAFFTGLDWVKHQCKKKLGFIPFPGTLNLEITGADVQLLKNLNDSTWEELVPPDKNFCSSNIMPVSVGHIKGALILPEAKVNIHGSHVIEIMAPVKLRDEIGLSDGDQVTVKLGEDSQNSTFRPCVSAALFDLDGTLIDSIESYYRIVEITLETMGLPKVPRQTILLAAQQDQFNWDLVLPEAIGQSKEKTIEKAWQMIEKIYPDEFLKNVKPFPDTGTVLNLIHSQQIKIGIVTSTPKKNIKEKMNILGRKGLSGLIDEVIDAGDVKRKKPFPDPLILCRDRLGMASDQCVYVGDMGIDIEAGKAAGMKTVGVLTGFETRRDLLKNNPDAIIGSISELPGILGIF